MGATVYLDCNVYALWRKDGSIGYVWREETYDKKEGIKQRHWCTMAIGGREIMIKRIFGLANSLPGGSLQTPSAISTPGFIKKLIDRLDNPLWLTSDMQIQWWNSENGFGDPITNHNRDKVAELFRKHGRTEWADGIQCSAKGGGSSTILASLIDDFELITELAKTPMKCQYGYESLVALPWRLVPHISVNSELRAHETEQMSTVAKPEMPPIRIWSRNFKGVNQCICLAQIGDRIFCVQGKNHDSELVQVAEKKELLHPGYYKLLFDAYKKAPVAAFLDSAVVSFDSSRMSKNDYRLDQFMILSQRIFGEKRDKFKLTFAQIDAIPQNENNLLYHTLQMLVDSDICSFDQLDSAAADRQLLTQTTLF